MAFLYSRLILVVLLARRQRPPIGGPRHCSAPENTTTLRDPRWEGGSAGERLAERDVTAKAFFELSRLQWPGEEVSLTQLAAEALQLASWLPFSTPSAMLVLAITEAVVDFTRDQN